MVLIDPASLPEHADPMNWRTRRFAGYEVVATAIASHLARRRLAPSGVDEPTGLLCHHLVFDEPCWRFVETLLRDCDGRVDWTGPGWHECGALADG
jgi:hypothetical protein